MMIKNCFRNFYSLIILSRKKCSYDSGLYSSSLGSTQTLNSSQNISSSQVSVIDLTSDTPSSPRTLCFLVPLLVMAYGPVYPRANRPATARAGPGQKKARRAEPVRAGPYGLGPGGLRANRSARRA